MDLKACLVFVVLASVLLVSGCLDERSQDDTMEPASVTSSSISPEDEAFISNVTVISDVELMQLEADMAEFERLVDEMEEEQGLLVEDV